MAGDGANITLDYQFQIGDSIAFGCGSGGIHLDMQHPIEGLLGVPDTKTQDVVYNFRDGSYPNPDYLQPRVVTIPCLTRTNGITDALSALAGIVDVWQPLDASVELAFKLPSHGLFKINGRPRGLKEDLALARFGCIRMLLRFDALSPTLVDL